MSQQLLDLTLNYWRAGLCVLPARPELKMPAVQEWKCYQTEFPTESAIRSWFPYHPRVCVLTGKISGNLELLDFDVQGELFPHWLDLVRERAPELIDRLFIERSPSGGFHVVYRCQEPVCGNIKLAEREVRVADANETEYRGKTYKPRKLPDGGYAIHPTLIETRGEGGLFLCYPTPGYLAEQGQLHEVPVLTGEEREILLDCAWSLNEHCREVVGSAMPRAEANGELRPGDEFNERGEIRDLLMKHGWTLVRPGDNEYWRRPGKNQGWSATLKKGVFFVFSSSAAPFEPQRGYSGFAVYAMLEHNGDFNKAAVVLRSSGYGSSRAPQVTSYTKSDLSKISPLLPLNMTQLVKQFPELRAPVIHGLLRQGETMNIIAASKVGKSWLTNDLALSVATGRPWLGMFTTTPGDVLIVDNELHRETSAHRLPLVAAARQISAEEYGGKIFVQNLRGQLRDLIGLKEYFDTLEPGRFKIIVLDAFYRFLPRETDENDNGSMSALYNYLDVYAERLGCCFVLVHHASKGNQSGKAVTDVGAGAGAQARAADTHLILRPHEVDDVVVLEAAVRSWPPQLPICLRWTYPVWTPDPSLDPTLLRQENRRRTSKEETTPEIVKPAWSTTKFVETFITDEPKLRGAILAAANDQDLSDHRAIAFLDKALACQLIHPWDLGRNRRAYALKPQPKVIPDVTSVDSSREKVLAMLEEFPELSSREIAQRCGVTIRWVQRLRHEKVEANE